MHPEDVWSLTAIETALPGYGWEGLAVVTHGAVWYIGLLVAPGVPELLLDGRERAFLTKIAYPALVTVSDAITAADMDEYVRTYSRPDGWRGAIGIYRSLLREGPEIKAIAESRKLEVPVLAIGARAAAFSERTMRAVSTTVQSVTLGGVGHYAAMEAPERVAEAMQNFMNGITSDKAGS